MRNSLIAALAAVATIAATRVAFADHGKAGLWQVTTTMTMAGMPPHSFKSTQCMTEAEAKAQVPPDMSNTGNCKIANQKMTTSSYTADMVCSGEAKGTGHIAVSYDTPTHYAGTITMAMNMSGEAMNTTNSFEGRWVSADCGKSAH